MSTATQAKGKDLYRILNVSRTASTHEIKMAYRKLALELHPDRTDGCNVKADAFKAAAEAYDVLSDYAKRKAYDVDFDRSSRVPPNYRKVYAPSPPPGFKIYDWKKHREMHYGDGMMKEEVERARKRAQDASGRDSSYGYRSPLGEGFTFSNNHDRNPYSKARQGPPPGRGIHIDYEEAHFYSMDNSSHENAKNVIRSRQEIRDRMKERRNERIKRQGQSERNEAQAEPACAVM